MRWAHHEAFSPRGAQATTVVPLPARSRCRACRAPAAAVRACSRSRGSSAAAPPGIEPDTVVRTARSRPPSDLPAARRPRCARRRDGPRCSTPPARRGTGRALRPAGWRAIPGRDVRESFSTPWRPMRSHSARSASTRPRSSSTDGCSWYASEWTSSLRRASPSRTARSVSAGAPTGAAISAAAHVDRQHGEPLRQVVVQLAREERALLLVRADEPLAQIAQLDLGALRLRNVAQDAERDRSRGHLRRARRRGRGVGSTSVRGRDARSDTRSRRGPGSRRAASGARRVPDDGRRDAGAPSRARRAPGPAAASTPGRRYRGTARRRTRRARRSRTS